MIFFSKNTSFKTRTLIDLCLGCDALRGSCQRTSASKTNGAIKGLDNDNDDAFEKLMDFT